MLKDVGIDETFSYDGFIGFELFLNYLKGITDINTLITYLKRIVVIRINSKYSHLSVEVREDLVQSLLLDIWRTIYTKKLMTNLMENRPNLPFKEGVRLFHEHLKTLIDRRLSRAFHEIYDDAVKLLPPEEYECGYVHRYQTIGHVENGIFLEDELPGVIRKEVLDHLRFDEANVREAARYIVDRVLAGKRVVRHWIKRNFRVVDSNFLVHHVLICVRACLYEVKATLEHKPYYEGSPLEEFFREHLSVR